MNEALEKLAEAMDNAPRTTDLKQLALEHWKDMITYSDPTLKELPMALLAVALTNTLVRGAMPLDQVRQFDTAVTTLRSILKAQNQNQSVVKLWTAAGGGRS